MRRRKTEYGSSPGSNTDGRRTIIRIHDTKDGVEQAQVAATSSSSSWRKSSLGAFPRNSLVLYTASFLAIIAIVAIGYQPPERSDATASAVDTSATAMTTGIPDVSIDDLYATKVAATIAETGGLPVAANVAELSQSIAAESVLARSDESIVAKPQIVKPTTDSRTIKIHVAKKGDTVQAIASQYGISASTVKWANNLQSDAVEKGRKLKILPVDGIIYTAEHGDTVARIAKKYRTTEAQIVAFNDLELSGLKKGQQLIVPDGILPNSERPGYTAPTTNYNNYGGGNYNVVNANAYLGGASAGNRYAFGNCTWYAYERRKQLGRPVGGNWGNASTWAMYASAAGYTVNGTPAPGAVMQSGAYGYFGYGHVAIVESVNPGKSITISEMNAYRFGGGFNVVGRGTISWNEATSGMFNYIH